MGFMDIFKPKYKHSNPEVRIEAVKEIEDEEILKDIAINDENKNVRWSSIKKMEDIITEKPFELNQYDIIENFCKEEISNITDEKELIDIAKNNDSYKMRTHAISKITDEKALIELLNYDKILLALAIVENPNLKDEKILNNLAKYNYSKLVREEAISKIHDQKTLAYIATHDKEKKLRKKAKLKISDKRILRDIEKKEEKRFVKNITSVNQLDNIPMNDKRLLLICKNNTNIEILQASARKISDVKYLEDIAQNAVDARIREAAVKHPKVNNQKILKHIYKNDKEHSVREEAIKKINDQQILNEAILDPKAGWGIHYTILDKITDPNVLKQVVLNDGSSHVRENAIAKITNQDVLIKVALNDENSYVRIEAVKKIDDIDVLKEILNKDEDEGVQRHAKERIQEIEKINNNNLNYKDYDYARKFRQAIESSSEWPPENSKAHEIYTQWNKNFPDDGNVYLAGVIIGVGNYFISKIKLKQELNKGQKTKKYDESQSTWLYNLAEKEFNSRFNS